MMRGKHLWSWPLIALLCVALNCGTGRGRDEQPTGGDGAGSTEKIGADNGTEPPVTRTEPSTRTEPPQADQTTTPETTTEPPVVTPDASEPVADRPSVPEMKPEPTTEPTPEPPPTGTCQGMGSLKSGDSKWTIKHDGVTRNYYVFIPPQYTGKSKVPVVLNFHGLNSNATQQKLLTDMNTLAGKEGFIAIHAEGRGVPQSWNGGLCCSPASSLLKSKDVDFVRTLLDDLEKKACIDTKRIYATGLSNGAYMSYRLACDLSDRIAAFAPVAGLLLTSPCKPQRPISAIVFHGTADLLVPYNGRSIIGWPSVKDSVGFFVKNNGCNSKSQEVFNKGDTKCEEWSGCKDNTKIRLCTTDGGGHTWPGGFPIPGLGKTTKDINATETMWQFLRAHRLP